MCCEFSTFFVVCARASPSTMYSLFLSRLFLLEASHVKLHTPKVFAAWAAHIQHILWKLSLNVDKFIHITNALYADASALLIFSCWFHHPRFVVRSTYVRAYRVHGKKTICLKILICSLWLLEPSYDKCIQWNLIHFYDVNFWKKRTNAPPPSFAR